MTQTQCPYCKKYLATEGVEITRLNSLYNTNNIAGWAKGQLKILGEMAEDHNLPDWYIKEVRRIENGISVTV
jgi:hypothetical protein